VTEENVSRSEQVIIPADIISSRCTSCVIIIIIIIIIIKKRNNFPYKLLGGKIVREGVRGSVLDKTLCCKWEGRGFET
jgi:hypothetical protein